MSFLIWRPAFHVDGICTLKEIGGVEDEYEVAEGVARAADWPATASCSMDPGFPRDIALADSLGGAGALIVSGRVKKLLDGERVNNTELLPLSIVNHKGRIASRDYFVVNPLDVFDCIDLAASVVEWNAIDRQSIFACRSLVLRGDDVPREAVIFRLRHWQELVIVRTALADRMTSAGFAGLHFIEPRAYNGMG